MRPIERLRTEAMEAALAADHRYPPPIAAILARELNAWATAGYFYGGELLIRGLIQAINAQPETQNSESVK